MLDNLKTHLYGYSDTFFQIKKEARQLFIILTGNKYDICSKRILGFLSFICEIANIPMSIFDQKQRIENDLKPYYQEIEEKSKDKINQEFITFLQEYNIEYSQDGKDLLTHSHGQLSVDEIYQIRYGNYQKIETIDIVLYPEDSEQIESIYKYSKEHSHHLIPYGGGTNVIGALLIKNKDEEKYYISVDMRKYNKIIEINHINNYAIIQSGACGREIEDYLNKEGYTMGHEPDSYEYSTLGGWISTNASGMRRKLYGNIEEIVIDFGYVNDHSRKLDSRYPVRHSHGSNITNLFIGHEGNFGIITDVLVNIHRLPDQFLFDSILFHNMDIGIEFMYEVQRRNLCPSSIRLVDNDQFKFGQALKPEKIGFLAKLIDRIKKYYVLNILGFDVDSMVACTLMIEGTKEFNQYTIREIKKLVKQFNGIFGGSENGKAGYNLTHSIAYIRDFVADYGFISETFETSIEWDKISPMTNAVRDALEEEVSNHIKSTPFFSYRVSQTYNTGVCIYFTFGFYNDPDKTVEEGIEIYHILEKCMRQAMIEYGGSISHHHGIGQIKADELKESNKNEIELHKKIKNNFDSKNLFCQNNYLYYTHLQKNGTL
jgi:alkyldihydroxyacetonephosphate synthase